MKGFQLPGTSPGQVTQVKPMSADVVDQQFEEEEYHGYDTQRRQEQEK